MEKVDRHHLMYEKRSAVTKLMKQVRCLSPFIVVVPIEPHRQLHRDIEPPEMPDRKTLLEMRELSQGGLYVVMNELHHPIVDHFERQLNVLGILNNLENL